MEMREILFRGKRVDNGERVYGTYGRHTSFDAMIIDRPYLDSNGDLTALNFWTVNPETVGQFTGLTDKNGVKIFEGDIVAYNKEYGGETREKGTVYWCDGAFWVENVQDEEDCGLLGALVKYQLEVIGNVHDNFELLEESNK